MHRVSHERFRGKLSKLTVFSFAFTHTRFTPVTVTFRIRFGMHVCRGWYSRGGDKLGEFPPLLLLFLSFNLVISLPGENLHCRLFSNSVLFLYCILRQYYMYSAYIHCNWHTDCRTQAKGWLFKPSLHFRIWPNVCTQWDRRRVNKKFISL